MRGGGGHAGLDPLNIIPAASVPLPMWCELLSGCRREQLRGSCSSAAARCQQQVGRQQVAERRAVVTPNANLRGGLRPGATDIMQRDGEALWLAGRGGGAHWCAAPRVEAQRGVQQPC